MPSELWTHMAAEHGVHLLDSEEADLVAAVERDRAARQSRMGDRFLAEIARDLGLQVADAPAARRMTASEAMAAEQRDESMRESASAARRRLAALEEMRIELEGEASGQLHDVPMPRGDTGELAASEDDFFKQAKPAPPSGRRFDLSVPDRRLV